MTSLRARFFLISWPLVVAAIAAVAFGVERWTVVELERIEAGPRPARDRARAQAWADTVAQRWAVVRSRDGAAALAALVAGLDSAPVLVAVDTGGAALAASDTTIRLEGTAELLGGVSRFARRRSDSRGTVSEETLAMSGIVVEGARGEPLGALYVIPAHRIPSLSESTAERRTALRRRIWSVALAASLAAAAAALLLAGPLVARVRQLADAAAAIRGGALDTRVQTDGTDELAVLGQSFNAMAESLGQAQRHQRNLVSDVAHELRTPLTNVIGLVEAIQDGLAAPDAATLSALRGEVGLLASLVHELQELSLAESGQLALTIETVDAVSACHEAIAAITPSAGGVALSAPATTEPMWVRADARRLGQVLRNLLRNAITNTPVHGRVTVSIEARAERIAIIVADTGSGIPAEHLALVFERFHRVDPSRDRASGGMGLGLAVVRQLVTAMGGRVWGESEPGRGARFGVELPRAG